MICGGLRTKGIQKKSEPEKPLITVVTVVFNGEKTLEQTIQSVVNQTYDNVEYIIIDGASTDGTLDIIKKYEDKIDYWQSESDKGIYDAMNKGIELARGEWINFMNSGDGFSSNDVIEKIFSSDSICLHNVTIVYGDYTKITSLGINYKYFSSNNIELLKKYPIYRHGASFVKTEYHKANLFCLERKDLGFALDYLFIFEAYKKDVIFRYVHLDILTYIEEGASFNIQKELKYNQKITGSSYIVACLKRIKYCLLANKIVHKFNTLILQFYQNIFINGILNVIPFWFIRKVFYFIGKISIGRKTNVNMFQHIIEPRNLKIGKNTHINRYCLLDCRGGIAIGDDVSISFNVKLITGSHNINSPHFSSSFAPIVIEDNVWIGAGAIILKDTVVGKGSVICAGAVVTKDVPSYSVVAGVPAKVIEKRSEDLKYHCVSPEYFL